ncbi:MAG: pirin family protein [Desulfuromonadales bacterium]
MITVRPSSRRGHFQSDWLDSWHTFSFDTYYDPEHMGFRALRVINEDRVKPGHGFPLHQHRDMEVITLVIAGELKHEDDLGHGAIIGPGEVQRFSAGTGIRHSEYNPSDSREVHLLQIWVLPEHKGLTPGYEQKNFSPEEFQGRLRLIGSRDGRDNSIVIHQDVALYRADLASGQQLSYAIAGGRCVWLQVIAGSLHCNGQELSAGDGASSSDENALTISSAARASFILFDLA